MHSESLMMYFPSCVIYCCIFSLKRFSFNFWFINQRIEVLSYNKLVCIEEREK